jgi:hypothetical protein
MERARCEVCRRLLPERPPRRAGPPQVYCDPAVRRCKDLAKHLRLAAEAAAEVAATLTEGDSGSFRFYVRQEANEIAVSGGARRE